MSKKCDHTSVGMIVSKDDQILLIERKKFPFGFAIPAGHVDADSTFESAARRELKEEVGLDAVDLKKIFDGRKENPCRREDGTWHHWKIYEVKIDGQINRSLDETKQVNWFDKEQIKKLSDRTDSYLNKEISEEEWEKNPGLEVIMNEFFKELKII